MRGERGRILLVDDDRAFRLSTAELLRGDGHRVETAVDAQEAVETLRSDGFDLMLLDLRMPGADGLQVVETLRSWGEGIPILMITGFGTIDSAVEAMQLGADDFLTKPVDPEDLSARVSALLERRPRLPSGGEQVIDNIIGRSPAMADVLEAIRVVAPTDTTVLITGATGTGKELVARAIHDESRRREGPFVPVNCAALAGGLLESELFGHVRGAFTGAVRDKPGLFEAARDGTIFLDEVGDVELPLQQRLLRVLQEREVRRVGSVEAIPVDVRVVAATNRELRDAVTAGHFRDDLYYRLNVFSIDLPPLRERRADIPLLVAAALERVRAKRPGSSPLRCSPLALRLLRAHDWPGNVRELFSVIEAAAIRSGGDRIDAQHLPAEVRESTMGGASHGRYRQQGSDSEERSAILAALEETDGVRARAAELLGMGRTTLWRKMKEYGLDES